MTRRMAVLMVMAVMLTCVAGTLAVGRREAPADSAASRWVRVVPGLVEHRLGLVGRIEAQRQVVLAAPFDGMIEAMQGQDGEVVAQGQALLTLDTGLLDIQLRQAEGEMLKAQAAALQLQQWEQGPEVLRAQRALGAARARLEELQAEEDDSRRLFDQGIVARMELETATRQLRAQRQELQAAREELGAVLARGNGEARHIADMELTNARARFEQLKASHDRRVVRAPFAGVLLRVQSPDGTAYPVIEQGVGVNRGQALWRLVDAQRLRVVSRVEEADLHLLREGMPVEVGGDGFADRLLSGHLESLAAQGTSSDTPGAGAFYEVRVAVAPGDMGEAPRPKLGMSARLAVITYRNEQGIVLPVEALRKDEQGHPYVMYRTEPGAVVERVEVGVSGAVAQGVEVRGLGKGEVEIP